MATQLTLMAVHAHPDDECFGGGGTLARYAAEGHNVVLVTCTNGEEGEILDPEMDVESTKSHLGDVRLQELNASVHILGISTLETLGYRDSGMAGTPANDNPLSFHQADLNETTARIVSLIRRYKPDVIFTYAEDGGYGHPDHLKAHESTVAAFNAAGDPRLFPDAGTAWTPRKLYYCVWMIREQAQGLWRALKSRHLPITFGEEPDSSAEPPEWGTPRAELTTFIDVPEYLDKKIEALAVHRTQIRRDSSFLHLPEDIAQQYLGVEAFRLAKSSVDTRQPETDLFSGLT